MLEKTPLSHSVQDDLYHHDHKQKRNHISSCYRVCCICSPFPIKVLRMPEALLSSLFKSLQTTITFPWPPLSHCLARWGSKVHLGKTSWKLPSSHLQRKSILSKNPFHFLFSINSLPDWYLCSLTDFISLHTRTYLFVKINPHKYLRNYINQF